MPTNSPMPGSRAVRRLKLLHEADGCHEFMLQQSANSVSDMTRPVIQSCPARMATTQALPSSSPMPSRRAVRSLNLLHKTEDCPELLLQHGNNLCIRHCQTTDHTALRGPDAHSTSSPMPSKHAVRSLNPSALHPLSPHMTPPTVSEVAGNIEHRAGRGAPASIHQCASAALIYASFHDHSYRMSTTDSRRRLPNGVLQLYLGNQAAAQDRACHSKSINNIGWQQPQLRHNLVRCQSCSAQLACHGQSQEERCLHAEINASCTGNSMQPGYQHRLKAKGSHKENVWR